MTSESVPVVEAAPRRTLGHQPALDGLRALAVLAVLAYHLGQANDLPWLASVTKGGFLGVSAFLTLSGFLITSLLILEYESVGHISLGGFWGRRFRRLLPASLLTLAVVAVLTPSIGTESQLASLPAEIWSTLAYVINWRFIFAGNDYAAVFNGAPSPIKHFWSLAVEEQCYLVLPFVVAVSMKFGNRRRRVIGTVFVLIAAASFGAVLFFGKGAYANRVYLGTDTRAGELAIGAVLAVAMAGRTHLTGRNWRLVSSFAGPVLLGMVLMVWTSMPLRASVLYEGGLTVHALAIAVVILAAMQPDSPLQHILSARFLTAIGRISYGVYLIHWPVLWWLTPSRTHLGTIGTAVAQVAVTFALAAVSYRLVEQPIRTGRFSIAGVRAVIPVGAMVGVAVLAAALPPPDEGKIVAISASKGVVVPTTKVGTVEQPTPEPVRVMVVGDSFALSVGLGLEHYATRSGDMATLNTGIVGCGFGRGGRNRGIGIEREWSAECQDRETQFAKQIAVFRPEVVLLAGGMWDVTDRQLAGTTTWTHVGDPAYDTYLQGEFLHLTDFFVTESAKANGGKAAKVMWATAPTFDPIYNPANFMGPGPYFEAQPGRSVRYNEILRATLGPRTDAQVVELAEWMQQWPGGEFAPDLRIDGVHFTVESTDKVADQFLGKLLVAAGRAG